MKRLLLLLFCAAPLVSAQQTPPASQPNLCDQVFSGIVETADHNTVGNLPGLSGNSIPWADVQFNHEQQLKVLDVLSKEGGKGGPYTITVSEVNACDGGPNVRVQSGSAYVEGVTFAGANRVARAGLKALDATLNRYEDREKKGAKMAWNHANAPKVCRSDTGEVLPPGQCKKQ